MAKVLITGISGQDGSYMAEYCLKLGHHVIGITRKDSSNSNYKHLWSYPGFQIHHGDVLDRFAIEYHLEYFKPDYFFNFAGQSSVSQSWNSPETTMEVNSIAVLRMLDNIRIFAPKCRFFNAGSSEEFNPSSPYAVSKVAAHNLIKVYRQSYNLYAIQGFLFNHESERRGEEFVTRKITKGLGRIVRAINNGESFEPIRLGNLDVKKDWSHAEDIIDGIWKMMNQDPNSEKGLFDYILRSDELHTVREFVEKACKHAGIEGSWVGKGHNECFVLPDYLSDVVNLKSHILFKVDSELYRPFNERDVCLSANLARLDLGWQPKISFDDLVKRMVEADLNA